MYKFLLLLFFFSKTILCAPQIEIIKSESHPICNDFVMLEGNLQAVTFRITGVDTEYVMDVFDGPVLRYKDGDDPICGVIDTNQRCDIFNTSDYTCLCEQISSTEYHLNFLSSTKAPREAYEIYIKWPKKGDLTTFITSEEFSIKEVKDETCEQSGMDKLLLGLIVAGCVVSACCLLGVSCFCYCKKRGPEVGGGRKEDTRQYYEKDDANFEQDHIPQPKESVSPDMYETDKGHVKNVGSAVDHFART